MRAWLQSEWQRLGGGALVLLPLSVLFALVAWLRRALYRAGILPKWRAPVPVVVVGNISAGGTGKTPLAIAILELLTRHGWNPGVVARGYGRVPRREHEPLGVVAVYPDVATPGHFGDEPVLIARRSRVPVYVSPDRVAAARALLDAHREVDVLVSDDGLQHYAPRAMSFAVVDGDRRRQRAAAASVCCASLCRAARSRRGGGQRAPRAGAAPAAVRDAPGGEAPPRSRQPLLAKSRAAARG